MTHLTFDPCIPLALWAPLALAAAMLLGMVRRGRPPPSAGAKMVGRGER